MRRPTVVLALAVVLAAVLAATALAAPRLAPGTINLSGTPTGSGTLEKDVAANFFLTKRVLGNQVHVTIDGHNAPGPPRRREHEVLCRQAPELGQAALRQALPRRHPRVRQDRVLADGARQDAAQAEPLDAPRSAEAARSRLASRPCLSPPALVGWRRWQRVWLTYGVPGGAWSGRW